MIKKISKITWPYLRHLAKKYWNIIFLRRRYFIDRSAVIENKNILIGENASINEGVIIRQASSRLEIGENSQIGPYTVIFGGGDIYIGNNVMIAPHCVISAANHDYKQTEVPMRFADTISSGPIRIGDNAWIGANCTITDGVVIGREAVVAAGSVVTKDVGEYDIAAGVPAKIIGNRIKS